MEVACPHCGEAVQVDDSQQDLSGRLRLCCDACESPFLIKLNRPELRVQGATADRSEEPVGTEPAENSAEQPVPESWMIVVHDLPETGINALRALLGQIPRFTRNPNKIPDMMSQFPYVFTGLSLEHSRRLEAFLQDCTASYEIGGSGRLPLAESPLGNPGEVAADEVPPDGPEEGPQQPGLTEETAAKPEGGAEPETADPQESVPSAEARTEETLRSQVVLLTVDVGPEVERYLGLVSARTIVPSSERNNDGVKKAEEKAARTLVDEAVELGAHAVLGLRTTVVALPGGETLVALQGSAVALVTPNEDT